MTKNRRIQAYRESLYAHSYDFEPCIPPVEVHGALVSRWGPGDHFLRRHRSNVSLNLVTMGSARFVQDGRTGSVRCGEVFIAHRGSSQLFETGTEGFLHKRTIIIDGRGVDLCFELMQLSSIDVVRPVDASHLESLFRLSYQLMRTKPPGFVIELSAMVWKVLLLCSQCASGGLPPRLQYGVTFIKGNLHRSLGVEEVAEALGSSVRHCTRLFARHLGCSPIEFHIRQKMVFAREMVVNTTLSIKQMAAALGYDDPQYFSVRFRKEFGESPRKLRSRKGAGTQRV